jgi:hypothetical protein
MLLRGGLKIQDRRYICRSAHACRRSLFANREKNSLAGSGTCTDLPPSLPLFVPPLSPHRVRCSPWVLLPLPPILFSALTCRSSSPCPSTVLFLPEPAAPYSPQPATAREGSRGFAGSRRYGGREEGRKGRGGREGGRGEPVRIVERSLSRGYPGARENKTALRRRLIAASIVMEGYKIESVDQYRSRLPGGRGEGRGFPADRPAGSNASRLDLCSALLSFQ